MSIREITIRRCIELQTASARRYQRSRVCRNIGETKVATEYQISAAAASEGMRTRLDRILGVGAIVEWSGSPDAADPDNYWIDDATGVRVQAN